MPEVKILAGTYAEYVAIETKSDSALYFCDNGQLYKGTTLYSDQIEVVEAIPANPVSGKIYINTTNNSVTYYNGDIPVTVVNETVDAINDSTNDNNLANVKAIKDFVAAEIAKIPAQVDYTVTLVDEVTADGELTKQTIKQGKVGSETEVGTIVVPDLKMEVKATPNDGYLKTYQFTYGTGSAFEIDIPKDLVVESGEVIVVTDDAPVSGLTNGTYLKLVIVNQAEPIYIEVSDENPVEGLANGTYLKLVIQNNDNPVYIDVKDLCDVYTGKTETTGISVAVSASNEISATLVGKAVTEANLDDALATKINDLESTLTWGSIA